MSNPNLDYTPRNWQVHRFDGRVAINLGNGATAYMTPSEVARLCAAATACAADIRIFRAINSHFITTHGRISGREHG